jgi:hypothetical protein
MSRENKYKNAKRAIRHDLAAAHVAQFVWGIIKEAYITSWSLGVGEGTTGIPRMALRRLFGYSNSIPSFPLLFRFIEFA